MKHNIKITLILVLMFLVTQFIGLAVIDADPLNLEYTNANGTVETVQNPALSFIQQPEIKDDSDYLKQTLPSILIAFVIAILVIFALIKFKLPSIIRVWFFIVVSVVLYITIIAFEKIVPWQIELRTAIFVAIAISLILTYFKIFKRNIVVHNLTELMIYPGIAVVFIPLLNTITIIILLILISFYDMWAVWHTGFMMKMANFQMKEAKIFGGFLIPYLSKKQAANLKKVKTVKGKTKKSKRIRINLAILGGGDVVFPIITAGVVFNALGLIPALIVVAGATIALTGLLLYSKKNKPYPAMPFITIGLFIGMAIAYSI